MNAIKADDNRSAKHSGFSTSFPIYLFTQTSEEVPIEETPLEETASKVEDEDDKDNDEAVVEEVPEDQEETNAPKTKTVVVDKWSHLNAAPPLWQRCVDSIEHLGSYFNIQLVQGPQRCVCT